MGPGKGRFLIANAKVGEERSKVGSGILVFEKVLFKLQGNKRRKQLVQ